MKTDWRDSVIILMNYVYYVQDEFFQGESRSPKQSVAELKFSIPMMFVGLLPTWAKFVIYFEQCGYQSAS
jgi:hypothetical protein